MAYNYNPYRDQDPLGTRTPSVPRKQQRAKYPPDLRNARVKRSRGSVFCRSLLALPWFVFSLGIIMLACSITWNKKFLEAAKQTGEVMTLSQVKKDSLLHKLWSPHQTIATATLAPAVVISLLVIATAAVQMATHARRTPRGTANSGWSTTYLGISGVLSLLMWFVMIWTVLLLVVSVVWLLSSVVVNTAARSALRQAQSQSNSTGIDLQAPDTPARLRQSYTKLLRPLLTKQDQVLTDTFLNSTLDAITASELSKTCRATCMDLTRFEDSLGTTACICDTKSVREFLAKSRNIRQDMISAVLCLLLVLIAASILLVIMVGRTVYTRHAMSFHSFRRDDSLPMVLPPPPTPPGNLQDEAFSIPSVTDPNTNTERQKMILWQQAQQQAASGHRHDPEQPPAVPPSPQPRPSSPSPYYSKNTSSRPVSPKPSHVSSPRYGPSQATSPRYGPPSSASARPSQATSSPRSGATAPIPAFAPAPAAAPAPAPARAPPSAPPIEIPSSPKHGVVSTRSPNFQFAAAKKSPTSPPPAPIPHTTSPTVVAMPPPYVGANLSQRRYNFAAAHLEVTRESNLRASQTSQRSQGSPTLPFDEPAPDVIVDRDRRQYFQARAAQAQLTGGVAPASAWRVAQ